MGRKSKYSADFKLMIIHEAETLGITRTSRKYSISDHTIRTWKLIYKYQGVIMPFKYTCKKENSLYA